MSGFWIALLVVAAACVAAIIYIGVCAVEEDQPTNNERRAWRRKDWEDRP